MVKMHGTLPARISRLELGAMYPRSNELTPQNPVSALRPGCLHRHINFHSLWSHRIHVSYIALGDRAFPLHPSSFPFQAKSSAALGPCARKKTLSFFAKQVLSMPMSNGKHLVSADRIVKEERL